MKWYNGKNIDPEIRKMLVNARSLLDAASKGELETVQKMVEEGAVMDTITWTLWNVHVIGLDIPQCTRQFHGRTYKTVFLASSFQRQEGPRTCLESKRSIRTKCSASNS